MRTDLLVILQWLSPAFPTGSFAYSHGLEAVIGAGERSASGIGAWIEGVLRHGAGQSDAVLLASVLRGGDAAGIDMLARAMAGTKERLAETVEQGAAFARTVAALTGRDLPPRCLPVAVGEAACVLKLPVEQVVGVYLHAFAANLVACATRFAPLGQTEGQAVLARLHPAVAELAAWASVSEVDDIGTAALAAEMSAIRHEEMDVRIFKT
ncbi:urease accessory protein UreF [Tabrizicola sp. YIM 78059]|uniref:urease accessory protein UreF n=1 Tax=Tabrizicola sp. YIM 78059 TaxID=2529861 RepID=UPI0010AB27FE|nr:urease accessory UreF family protein [Tabrizicola sp. YIM 78059]